jgi:Tol biopolymer transport system component
LFAVRFDVTKLQLVGGPVTILEDVARSSDGASGIAQFAFSNNGSMVYVPGELGRSDQRILALVDRTGIPKPLNIPAANYMQPRISPNGKQLVLDIDDGRETFVALYDLAGTAPLRRLTFGGRNERPLWSRNGERIVFVSDRDGDESLFWQPADGGPAERLAKFEPGNLPQPESWTPDEKTLVFTNRAGARSPGLGTLPMGTDQPPKIIIKSPATNASLSPDGRWLAYHSIASGRTNVYVESFPPTGTKYQVSTDGVYNPLWSPNGKQLYYVTLTGRQLVSVDVHQTQSSLVFGKTTPLPIQGIPARGPRSYDVMPDGKSFVVLLPLSPAEPGKAPPEQINLTLNWFEELKQRVP